MKTFSLLAIFALFSTACLAQPVKESRVSLDIAAGGNQGTITSAFYHNWFVGKNKKIFLGAGARFTAYVGRNQSYVTAPAKLTSNGTGPLVIFKENVVTNMDTLLLAKPNVYALNAMVNLGYQFNPRLQVGFNIDVVGVSFGGRQRGTYINGHQEQMTNAKVTGFNALLISDNDIGSLNSELYGSYNIGDRWSLRTGLQFLFTEYTTDTKVQQFPEPNDRFRKKSLMFMAGTSFRLK